MPFSLSLLSRDDAAGIIHLAAEGEATAVDFPVGNGAHFDQLLGHDWNTHCLLLNLERLSYIDSSAIGWLIVSQKACRTHGGQLVIHSVQPGVRNVLELLKIGRVVPIADTPAAGRKLFTTKPLAAQTR
jgi:anti-anti-sigma factor